MPRAENLLVASVASHRRQHSGLFVRFHTAPAAGDANIVAQAAQSLALIHMNAQARADAENRVRGELAVDLIAGTRSLDELEARARLNDFSLAGPWRMMTIQAGPGVDEHLGARLARIEPRILLTQRSPGLTVLVPSSVADSRLSLKRLSAEPEVLGGCLVVASDSDCDRSQLAVVEDELWSCVRILNSLGIDEGIHPAADFAPYTAMFGTAPEQVGRFIDRLLGPLRDWDRKHSAELTDTVRVYFESNGSISRTAAALSVHINTVKQRLERVDQVLGEGWRAPEFAFRLQVALRLDRLTLPR